MPHEATVHSAHPEEAEDIGFEHEKLEGWIPALATEDELRVALEKAFDYRGDVTLSKRDGSVIEGYLFDRFSAPTLQGSYVRLLIATGAKVSVPYSEIASLVFSGRDTAAGRSWEAWVKKYWEKRQAGETNIELKPESLD